MAILGLILGRALGLNFGHFGPEFGQGSGPQFWPFWTKFAFKPPLNFDQKWENLKIAKSCQICPKVAKLPKLGKMQISHNCQKCLNLPKPPNVAKIHQNCQKGQNWQNNFKFCRRAKFAFKTPLKFDKSSKIPKMPKMAKYVKFVQNCHDWGLGRVPPKRLGTRARSSRKIGD